MDKLKQWVALTVVACLAIVAAGWFLVVSPKRGEAAELRTQAQDQQTTNAKLRTELDVLKAQAKDLPKEQAKLAAVAAKVPDNPALPSLVRDLMKAAESSGVELVTVEPGEPVVEAPVTPVAPVAGAQGQTAPAEDPAAPAPAEPAAVVGPAGQLASLPVSVEVYGEYFAVQQFMAAVEELSRAFRVVSLDMEPGASPADPSPDDDAVEAGRSLKASVNGFVYMAANRPAPVTATVPGDEATPAQAPAADAAAAPTADPAE